jgi:hypothetical protein
MSEPLLSSRDQEFDLTSEAVRLRRNAKIGRIIVGLTGGTFIVIGARFLLESSYPLQVGTPLVFAALFWEFGLLLILGLVFKKPPAPLTRIRLTATVVTLTFYDGREVTQSWTSELLGLTFRDTSLGRPPREGSVRRRTLFAPGGLFGSVPEPVAAAIVQSARLKGVSVSTRQETVGRGKRGYEALITRIGSLGAAPTPK